ncbi:uncharacterized protein LY79DRAFT_335646 [Colletotrichum navitas]|uniref:Uncharacterized protein n=1 Tax=Colletotrichum navitas TaxID=681940 RepID=A0AAD8V2J2_9PEZI|nr:uncharacterized protein LY79DRAFT_335646 [Colletotrichum navitas]KAK1579804.1 hypothetical protein LY79DRAFT_335646 [Colletotrichum navitas]
MGLRLMMHLLSSRAFGECYPGHLMFLGLLGLRTLRGFSEDGLVRPQLYSVLRLMTFRLSLLSTRVNKNTTQDSDFLLLETGCGSPLSLSVQAILFCIPITNITVGNRAPLAVIQWVNQDLAHASRKPCYEFMNKIHPEWMSSGAEFRHDADTTRKIVYKVSLHSDMYGKVHTNTRKKKNGGGATKLRSSRGWVTGEDVKKPVRPTKTARDPCYAGGWVSCVVW